MLRMTADKNLSRLNIEIETEWGFSPTVLPLNSTSNTYLNTRFGRCKAKHGIGK